MEPCPANYEYLGWYSPFEAKQLLDAFEVEGIGFHASFRDQLGDLSGVEAAHGGFGGNSLVCIAVESARRAEADAIHSAVFGDCLPNLGDGNEEHAEWCDDNTAEEASLLEKRNFLARRLAELRGELQELLTEVAAVDDELLQRDLLEWRVQALTAARERHRATGSQLLAEQARVQEELRVIAARFNQNDVTSAGPDANKG